MILAELVEHRSIVVCCGTGGVGKTTTAAALAIEGARRGRRVVVVTIDPARRLADALGLAGGIGDAPTLIDGPWSGELWAAMLDTRSTFDALVRRHAADQRQAERILANRFYRNIAGALSGTQEYMAMEKLHELHEEAGFELVVVDTPPTRHALDFLDAPRRLARFLDHRLYRVLVLPTRAYLKAANLAAQAFLRTVARVVGAEVIEDAVAFFQAFDGMEEGFRRRAERVVELLASDGTAFVLVVAPRADALAEARGFAAKLAEQGIAVEAVVANRVQRRYLAADQVAVLAGRAAGPANPAGSSGGALAEQVANLAMLSARAEHEEELLVALAAEVGPAPLVRVPQLDADVHDLTGLDEVGTHLFGR